MYEIRECSVCGGTEFNIYMKCKDYFLSQEEFNIMTCKSCGFRFTNPRPDENMLGNYYESDDYISHSNKKSGIISRIYQLVRKHTLKRKYRLVSKYCKSGSILDIGSATGEFLNYFKQNNWEVCGIEPDSDAREYAVKNYQINVFEEAELLNFESNKFDVISMWHVLEHVAPLQNRIEQIKRVLKENGVLIVAVPNSDSLDAKIYKNFWAAWDVPRHLYHFTQGSIRQLFEKNSFKLIETKAMKFDSYYVSLLSEKYKSHKANYHKALWNGFRSNVHARSNNKEYSSLIYIFRRVNT
jgi:SAM-dependent methyltransferase